MPFLKFYIPSIEILDLEIKNTINTGSTRFLVVQKDKNIHALIKRFAKEKLTFHILKNTQVQTLHNKINEYDVIILTEDKDLNSLSKQLLSCLNIENGTVLAPLTDNYFMKRPLFLMTIPKSGTHMLINMLHHLNVKRNFSHTSVPGKYSTLEHYTYHAPCKEFMMREWPEPIGRHPLFQSPAIFMYRNPLDIIASEFYWYQKSDIAFSHYLKTFKKQDEKLMHLIDDALVMGTIRDRMNMYIGWLDFSNVIPISYEELVGSNGGASDIEQTKTIWSLQLKLHITGDPVELAKTLYNEKSPTFNKGQIGRHKKLFKKIHYDRFRELPQDFMEKMGYNINTIGIPKYADVFRKRTLEYWIPTEKELWMQRLVKENYMGYNIISTAGQYVALPIRLGTVDLSKESDRKKEGIYLGFESLEEVTQFIKQNFSLPKPQLLDSYQNYNLVGYNDCIYAVLQGIDLDLVKIKKGKLKEYQDKRKCFVGNSIEEVKKVIDQKGISIPELLESYQDYNLVRYRDRIYAVLKRIDLDLAEIKQGDLNTYQDKNECFVGNSIEEVKKLVNQKGIPIPKLLESYREYNLVDYKGRVYAVRQGTDLDLTEIEQGDLSTYQEKNECFIGSSIEEVKKEIEQNGFSLPVLLESYKRFNIIRYNNRIYAVLNEFKLDLTKTTESILREYQDKKELFIANSIDEVKKLVNQSQIPIPKLLESYQNYNLVRYRDRFYALLQGCNLDLVKIKRGKLKEYQDKKKCFVGSSIGGVKKEIEQEGISVPKLLESYQNYNLVRYEDRIYALLQGVDLDPTQIKKDKLKEYQDKRKCFVGNSIDEAKNFINHLAPLPGVVSQDE